MKRRALISVSDKRGVEDFARRLSGMGFEIISTGGQRGRSRRPESRSSPSPR